MKIINEIKLDFDNILIKPKRSTLPSKSEIDLLREFTFPHSKRKLKCVPIVSANMDTTGACTYVGARKLKDLLKKTTFILVNDTHNRVYEK